MNPVESLDGRAFRLASQIIEELSPITILESGEVRIYSEGRLAPFGEERSKLGLKKS